MCLPACNKPDIAKETSQGTDLKGSGKLATNSTSYPDFMIAVIPDTQTYTSESVSYTPHPVIGMFYKQTQWIAQHKVDSNIVYVVHLGDISENGDNITVSSHSLDTIQWKRSDTAMAILDNANVPYGMAVGNHDEGNQNQTDRGNSLSTTQFYNKYFGYNNPRFSGKPFYGGHYGTDNNNHYDLFSAGGLDFIVIYLAYDDQSATANVNARSARNLWAKNLLTTTYASRKAIIVTHYVGGPTTPSVYSVPQTQEIYATLSTCPNIFMFLGGHVNGEGYRQDTKAGRTIKSFISDYQFKYAGGNGFMRIMKFSRNKDLISVKTYSPYADSSKTGATSQFTKAWFHEQTTTRNCDFNNDGMSDLAFYNTGTWTVNGLANVTYGISGDIPAPADYDGNGKTDYAIFRPSEGKFYIKGQTTVTWGVAGDIPVPGDYDGDGIAECAIWRPSTFTWYYKGEAASTAYGQAGDIPTPGDYDGDGIVDFSVYRPGATGKFWIHNQTGINIGTTGDIPVPGDYDADGKTDPAVFRPSTGVWYINGQANIPALVTAAAGDIPAPGDYFGDGHTHPAVYRPSTHVLYMYNGGTITTLTFSAPGKILNLPYSIRQAFGF